MVVVMVMVGVRVGVGVRVMVSRLLGPPCPHHPHEAMAPPRYPDTVEGGHGAARLVTSPTPRHDTSPEL